MALFSKQLTLKKTHDHCASKEPRLTVVFIHGIATDSSCFSRAIDYLEGTRSLQDIRFVTFDLLGSGKSLQSDKLNYDYVEQLEALDNAIKKLRITTPLVLVGHSMGTLIVTRYAYKNKKSIKRLILLSPPTYTEQDLEHPSFKAGMKAFGEVVGAKNRKAIEGKPFAASIKNIVSDKRNYEILTNLKTPTIMIYGALDQYIGAQNIPKALEANPKYLTAIQTDGKHGVSKDKYSKMVGILEEILNEVS